MNRIVVAPALVFLLSALVSETAFPQSTPGNRAIDLLAALPGNPQALAGKWERRGTELRVAPATAARCLLTDAVPSDYDLSVEFTREEGDDSVAVILPVGGASPALELSAWQGEAHGLSRIDGLPVKDPKHPAAYRPGTLENGKRQKLLVRVRTTDGTATVRANLNGTPLFDWSGPASRLAPNRVLSIPGGRGLALAAQNVAVTFHAVSLLPAGSPSPASSPPSSGESTPGSIDLSRLAETGTPGWHPFHGAAFEVVEEDGRTVVRALPDAGSGDRGAWIEDLRLAEGTIEVDLRGAAAAGGSFLGILFHAEDEDTYDAVYFRPFNFGHSDPLRRGHAVQYMSHPDWPWDRLRRERPEEFENPAVPEPGPDQWFRARIQLQGKRVRVWIDDADSPCLDVEKVSETTSGRIGLWYNGVASFAGLEIRPTK